MNIAFVLGNGISRRGLGLNGLRPYGKIYGCNSLYTEFEPNVLVATDKPISARIQESGYSAKNVFYTRKPLPGLGALAIPKQYYGFSSGPAAAGIAAFDANQQIYLIGFDCGPTSDQHFNNIYAGTEFYKPVTSLPTFTGNWIRQIRTVTKDFPNTRFFRVTGATTARMSELDSIPNLKHLSIDKFLEYIYSLQL
ncbi:hypothetical protein UFOVP1146_9 [uncultured Caudovirales phage]|uniref:Uncharacterized protein n=1 Tax=uncultured Caudovirales phage TaxID=2100421 RepID=A0A6J5T050_9CAUD|nr:hypothetical protein UFOVP812_342 [uncultured Caudovirales phage]CAB4165687.1 hypothetical protein UFOVP818_223 [uncultured Caudovirales phage]CAB4186623.1 hypothetical protein UFOVP1146_9 [uncultured Caudovirales phage]CAB4221055.1 hypothetical protein UFOVP1638_136 [uncultured Caudovirales phage]